jgi:hypothetical protein
MRALTVVMSEAAVPEAGRVGGPVRRMRIAMVHPDTGAPIVDEHLRAQLPAPGPWPLLADVLLAKGDEAQSAELAARHPGALVIAVHGGSECCLRLGPEDLVRTLRTRPPASGASWAIWASLAHTWLVAGLPVAALGSASVRVLRAHSAALPSRLPSRARTAKASADSDRPTAEKRSNASR